MIENLMNKQVAAGFRVSGTFKRSGFRICNKFPAPMLREEVNISAKGEFIQELIVLRPGTLGRFWCN